MPLTAGTRLGPYGILPPLGAGSICKARDPRFDREARAVAALNPSAHQHAIRRRMPYGRLRRMASLGEARRVRAAGCLRVTSRESAGTWQDIARPAAHHGHDQRAGDVGEAGMLYGYAAAPRLPARSGRSGGREA